MNKSNNFEIKKFLNIDGLTNLWKGIKTYIDNSIDTVKGSITTAISNLDSSKVLYKSSEDIENGLKSGQLFFTKISITDGKLDNNCESKPVTIDDVIDLNSLTIDEICEICKDEII